MKETKHLFFVQSDFHYIICKNIINYRSLNPKTCYFACKRGLKVDETDQQCAFFGDGILSLKDKFKYYIKNWKEINSFFSNSDIIAYSPFRYCFPNHYIFKEYVFFEEGLSSYRLAETITPIRERFKIKRETLKYFILSSVFDKNIVGYFMGIYFPLSNKILRKRCDLISCSSDAYKHIDHPLLCKKSLPINVKLDIKYDIPKGCNLLVLERFRSGGSYSSLDNYKRCLRLEIERLHEHGVKELWIKFHPIDFNNPSAQEIFKSILKGIDIKVHMFDGRLEYLAVQNIGVNFIGLTSTSLYYAPILGNNNTSISFFKTLWNLDEGFKKYIELYGGYEHFYNFFAENVSCH